MPVIPCNKELCISITKRVIEGNRIKYLMNFFEANRLLNSSFDKLPKYLDPSQFKALRKALNNPDKFALISRKGAFSYDYMSDIKKFDDPSRDSFHNYLPDREGSETDYYLEGVGRIRVSNPQRLYGSITPKRYIDTNRRVRQFQDLINIY